MITTSPQDTYKAKTINVRAFEHQRDLIDCAANLLGRSRSDFMLEAACQKAEDVLLDTVFFNCDDDSWKKLCEALDSPPVVNAKLQKLLTTKSPWE